MPQHHGRNIRPSHHRTSPCVIISISACVVLLFVDLTIAFPTVRVSSRAKNSCFNSCNSICSEREYHLSCAGFGVGRHTQQFWKTKRSSSLAPLRARSKSYLDSQDEFQRSLLAAKIANDIKGTAVKEESHRQERVEKQIVEEKEKLEAAVKEVQEAAQNVTQSAKTLGGAVISNSTEVVEAVVDVSQSARSLGGAVIFNGLGIITRFLTTLLGSEEFRLVTLLGLPKGWSSCICQLMFISLLFYRKDLLRRRPHYLSDWTDGFKRKRQVIPAVLFLYFACLAPAVSFGTIASEITNGSIGVVEFLLGSGMAGMLYSIFSGQPMAFLAPTGLTLAFTSGLFRFCSIRQMSFFPVYAWVGIWTSFFMTLLGVAGSSKAIRYCTRFTDEVFNGLLSVNFIYEAVSSLRRNFMIAHMNDPMNLTMPFVALSMALGTFLSTMKVVKFEATKFFNTKVRTQIKNFGPVTVILTFTLLNLLPWFKKFHVPTLTVPDTFQLAGGRSFLVGLTDIPNNCRMLCALPALLLTALFFMDQNISVRLVNSPDNKLKKGSAYNLDLVALGVITGGECLEIAGGCRFISFAFSDLTKFAFVCC